MFSFKFKIPFTLILIGLFVPLLLISCGQTGDRQSTVGPGAADNFSSPIPAPLEKLRTGLNARVIVDGGTPNEQIIQLQVDTQNDRVVGTIPNLPVGPHTFEIQYFIDSILIATAPVVTITIQANADTPVPFDAGVLVYPDTDNDGFSNLNEVEIFGSASDAWSNAATKPTVSVIVNPATAILPPNGVQTFTAAITQNANQGVTWSVEGGNGTITPGGTYTAPATPGTYSMVATSQADPTKSATIAVKVVKAAEIDLTFDGDGILTTSIGISSRIGDLAVQTDGKIVAAGISVQGSANQFTLARYNIDGTLDATFDGDGIVTTTIGASSFARTVALQTDGKIVVGGDSGGQFALTRYNIDGTLDTTFDGDGIVTTTNLSAAAGYDLVIQGNDKIVLAGQSNFGGAVTATLARFNSDGSLDTTFDIDGIVTTPTGDVRAAALQSDGKIIIAGQSASHFFLARYNSNGSPDTTFDSDGVVSTTIGTASFAMDLAIQPDGKIIASGSSTSGTINLALARYNTNGSPDTTFDTDGIVTTTIVTSNIGNKQAVALQTDGKIIVTGPLVLARFNSNGAFDSTFNGGTTAITIGTEGLFHNLILQADGKIIVGGQLSNHFTLARFQTAAPAVLLRANLSGDQETSPVTTTSIGSATFVISPGGTEVSYMVATSDLNVSTVTATHIHFAASDGSDPILFSLPSSGFVSPLNGKVTNANLGPLASVLPGVKATFADAVNAIRNGQTYIHIHTTTHLGGEIRGSILVVPPTLSSLQAQIFTPRCALCHIPAGPGAEETGLDLSTDRETTFNMLVNVPSTEDPTFKRVEPGNPDASYLIKKLEGTPPPRNTRMPANGPPFLSDEEIKKVRDWISAGAKND